jgi:serine/threonine protein kinase
VEVSRSQFPHEQEGLDIAQALLPDATPFRAWSNFEFRDNNGKWHEVDLLVLGRRQLHLVELKYYSGTIEGDDLHWRRNGRNAEDSPLKLAQRKAQRLADKLRTLDRMAQRAGGNPSGSTPMVPFVQTAVFLHHPRVRCRLPRDSRKDLYGLDKAKGTGLPGISSLLTQPSTREHEIGREQEEHVVALMSQLGAAPRRTRKVGSWLIDGEPIGEGDGWQDWPASNQADETERVRIRFYITPRGASGAAEAAVRRLAEHEYRIMRQLANDRLLRPRDIVKHELGVGLVYPFDERFQRLDWWLADQAASISTADRLALVREVAETVAYAHDNRVVHRGLTPHAVLVRPLSGGKLQILVGDWQSAGVLSGPAMTGLPARGITELNGLDGASAQSGPVRQPSPGAADVDRTWAEAFQAPEGIWSRGADRIRLDVFALGTLTYYLLVGRSPAASLAELRDRLTREHGLDVRAELPQIQSAVRDLVRAATRSVVTERLPDVQSFVKLLAAAEEAMTITAGEVHDPLEASPRSVIDGRFRLERRLGAGSTAVGLLVTDLHRAERRVLKVAVDDAAAARLADEATVLGNLDHPRLVRLVEGPVEIGSRQALILEMAGEETLAAVLHLIPRLPSNLVRRWGSDLLEALVALDQAGVVHRDIKPANLGIRKDDHEQADHLVLFDFSLASAGATAVTVGTFPYLDPFLGSQNRGRYDSAAERYSAAVVLFEMATGATPRFGDGESDPASVREEAAIDDHMFDPAHAGALAAFFRTALARDARNRHANADEMLSGWQAVFADSVVEGRLAETMAEAALRLMNDAEALTRSIDSGAQNVNYVQEGLLSDIAFVLARVDPARAEHLAGGLSVDRAAALARIARTVAQTDPAQAARLLTDAQARVRDSAQHLPWRLTELLLVRRQIIRAVVGRGTLVPVIRSVARIDPAAAAHLLDDAQQLAILDESLREELLAGIAEATTVVSPAQAEQIAYLIDNTERRAEALGRVAAALVDDDPARAEHIAGRLGTETMKPRSASALWAVRALVAIARVTPAADRPRQRRLLARAEQLARRTGSHRALTEVASAVVTVDRDHALQLLAETDDRDCDSESLLRMVKAMAGADPARAEELARGITEEADRAAALAHLAVVAKTADAARAAAILAEAEQAARAVTDPLIRRPEALVRVAVAAAVVDPARAESIARSLEHELADPQLNYQLWTVRALVSVAAAWLGPGNELGIVT